ncbi:chemotaxis protein MotA [Alteribacillus persepolensis]|uniref:Chemotaxis protein MotA n=1 Tax=Alteribacillus persepolensis TaxID=568899 RepID=A0A1G8BDM0_9BACI|nr:flagellar motor protein MotP [Alteribacillus persepolensis]SDH31299.1 chemotaxis protein MotA [Alteribacillus persepolensis]
MKKLDILTPIGILLGISTLLFAIFTNAGMESVVFFIQLTAFLIVFGGIAAALLISFSFKEIKKMPKVAQQAFRHDDNDLPQLIDTFSHLSTKARREGLLALEAELDEVEDPYIRKGVLLAVDGMEPDVIKDIMMAEVVALEERHRKGRLFFEKAGEYAPAWGMVGTLIGLVLMLQELEDPATLGPNMAVALMTTLYGTVLANLVFLPMSNKLEQKTEDEVFVKQIVIEGVIGVQSGQNPKILEEKLTAFVRKNNKQEQLEETEELANEA